MPESSVIMMQEQFNEWVKLLSAKAGVTLVLGDTDILTASDKVTFLPQDQLQRLPELEQFDFILIQELLEKLPRETGEHVIAQVRDCHAREMVLVVQVEPEWQENKNCWQPNNFIGLGMKLIAEFKQQNSSIHAYYYAVETYKKTPDWLNNKHWANPELFNKHRW